MRAWVLALLCFSAVAHAGPSRVEAPEAFARDVLDLLTTSSGGPAALKRLEALRIVAPKAAWAAMDAVSAALSAADVDPAEAERSLRVLISVLGGLAPDDYGVQMRVVSVLDTGPGVGVDAAESRARAQILRARFPDEGAPHGLLANHQEGMEALRGFARCVALEPSQGWCREAARLRARQLQGAHCASGAVRDDFGLFAPGTVEAGRKVRDGAVEVFVAKVPIVSAAHVAEVRAEGPDLAIRLDEVGAQALATYTAAHVGQPLIIVSGAKVLTMPIVRGVVTGGRVSLSQAEGLGLDALCTCTTKTALPEDLRHLAQ